MAVGAALLATGGARPLTAQVPLPAGAGAGSPYAAVARARGVAGVLANPATLALPGSATRALLLPSPGIRLGLHPVGVGDLAAWSGREAPRSVREGWLREVERAGAERGRAAVSAVWIAGRDGSLGAHVSTTVAARARLDPDAAELLLFGNAGRTGEPRPLAPAGSSLDAWALTRAAVVAASLVPTGPRGIPGSLSVGASLGVSVGHGLLLARDAGSRVTGDDPTFEVDFPRLETAGLLDPAGWGIDVDLGAAWEAGAWSLGAVLTDAVSTFRWSREALRHRSGRARLGAADPEGDATPSGAPRVLLEALDDATPAPALVVEAAHRLTPRLRASAGARRRLRAGLDSEPAGSLGAALSWEATRALTVQGGLSAGGGEVAWSAGARSEAGPVDAFASVLWASGGPAGLAAGVSVPLGGRGPA